MSRRTLRWGAAAFALGMSLAGPQALAIADSSDEESGGSPANPAATADAASQGRPAIARRGKPDQPVPATTATVRTPAAEPATAATRDVRHPAPQRSSASGQRGRAQAGRTSAAVTGEVTGARAGGAAWDDVTAAVAPSGAPTADAPGTAVVTDSAVPVDVSASTTTPTAPPAPVSAGTVGTLGIPAGAATADPAADALSGILAPLQAFLEGIGLLIRRTFFNEAPTVNPVQLTGQAAGLITGSVGAVDPEGDPIIYSVTAVPSFGTVTIAPDGSYAYTPGTGFAGTDAFTVSTADTGLHINLLNPLRPAYTLGNAVVTQGLTGPRIQFEFTYAGGSLYWSQEARAALESSATILGSYFAVSAPVTITYSVTGELAPLSGTLATASSDIISSRPGAFPTVVQNKIISGVDANGSAPDGTITLNFSNPWAFGATVDNGQYDFQSVALHELVHTFGFLSNVSAPGTNDGTGWTTFDGYLVSADGTRVINGDYTWNPAYDVNLSGGGGGLFFGGPAAVAAYGRPVPVFTPDPWQGGSSLSHLDDMSFYGRNEKLMNARVSTGSGIRTLSAVETAILADLGYTMVPAPSASVVILFGMLLLRRRRADSARP